MYQSKSNKGTILAVRSYGGDCTLLPQDVSMVTHLCLETALMGPVGYWVTAPSLPPSKKRNIHDFVGSPSTVTSCLIDVGLDSGVCLLMEHS